MNFQRLPFNVLILVFSTAFISTAVKAQYVSGKGNDVTTPLHLIKPDYVTPYGETTKENVKEVLDRVYSYLDTVTPAQLINPRTKENIADISKADTGSIFKQGDFRLTSYEWGVTYTGMLEAGLATGDKKFIDYTIQRVNFIGQESQIGPTSASLA